MAVNVIPTLCGICLTNPWPSQIGRFWLLLSKCSFGERFALLGELSSTVRDSLSAQLLGISRMTGSSQSLLFRTDSRWEKYFEIWPSGLVIICRVHNSILHFYVPGSRLCYCCQIFFSLLSQTFLPCTNLPENNDRLFGAAEEEGRTIMPVIVLPELPEFGPSVNEIRRRRVVGRVRGESRFISRSIRYLWISSN